VKALWVMVLLIAAGAIVAPAASGEQTGNKWRSWTKPERDMFIIGVLDGWTLSMKGDAPVSKQPTLETAVTACMVQQKVTYEQVIAVVEKYMREEPKWWNSSMTAIVLAALVPLCPEVDAQLREFRERGKQPAVLKPDA